VSLDAPFAQAPFAKLLELIAARTPTPGGGTVAALAGALGGALGCMAVRFSAKRKDSTPEKDAVLATVEQGLLDVAARLSRLADDDAASFEAVRAARKLPQANAEEAAARDAALRDATAHSAAIPMQTAKLCKEAMELLDGVLPALNPNLATDAASGALLLRAGVRCAGWNVLVNLVGDPSSGAEARRSEIAKLSTRAEELETRVGAWTKAQLER
jgi:glutamate formiminotransferase/formiminotetrahydrofolate cyclodeaminase